MNAVGRHQCQIDEKVGNIIIEFRYKYVSPEFGILDRVGRAFTPRTVPGRPLITPSITLKLTPAAADSLLAYILSA